MNKRAGWLLLPLFIIITAALPLLLPPPGLTSPEAVGPYLNNVFPPIPPSDNIEIVPAFSNLSFDSPLTWTMDPHRDSIFIGQRDGKIFWFDQNQPNPNKSLMLDLSAQVGVVWDGGFLGMVFHPDFGVAGAPGRNYFYTYYTSKDSLGGNEPTTPLPQRCPEDAIWNGNYVILSRFEVSEGTLNVIPNSETIMIKVRMYNSTHRGGGMVFGQDGFLYLTTGDQAQHSTAQTLDNNLDGGLLRIDVDKDPSRSHAPTYLMPKDVRSPDEISGVEYWIPNSNPFNGTPNVFEEYYTIGHRNPHRLTMDPHDGKMYIGEVGAGTHEEINVVTIGKNYGWPIYEGNVIKNVCINQLYNNMAHESPLVAFPRSEANSLIGGYVYRGSRVPALTGRYICGDWGSGEELWSVNPNSGEYDFLATFLPGNIISFGQDHDGEIFLLKQGDGVNLYTIDAPGTQVSLPPTLSTTGAFSDLTSLSPASGLVPYELVESFWSENAQKKRWMAIPNDGTHDTPAEQIKFSETGEWEFPIGTVLIKHFELPIDDNNPNLTQRLETRFSIKGSDGKFYFLTYKWRADGSDADLIDTSIDETFSITTSGGTRSQTWHFPSRSECLTCHSDALGGTLGPRTRFLNKDFDYAGGSLANQLVTLSHLGILDQSIFDTETSSFLTAAAKDDPNASLELRAKSYLDLNCGYCHRPSTGNRAVFDARLSTPTAYSAFFTQDLNESIGLPEEWVIKAGDTAASVLFQRLHSTDPTIMMPPIAKSVIDQAGADLIAEWIMSLSSQNSSCTPVNLAPGKTVTQSSTYPSSRSFEAENAIDGSTNGAAGSNSITHTLYDTNAWWEIDLGDTYALSGIKLFNRTDCCAERLANFYILVSEQPFVSQDLSSTINQAGVMAIHHQGSVGREGYWDIHRAGRYLRVQLAGSGYLSLAEAEILGCTPPPPICNATNVALGKATDQSSTYLSGYSFVPSNVVDGNNNGDDAGNSMNHTKYDQNPWWEVDLGTSYDLEDIKIWNRTDCCSGRLNNFYVFVSDQPFNSTDLNNTLNDNNVSSLHFPGVAGRETDLSLNAQGRYLRIQLGGSGYLTLAEVEVMACQAPPTVCNTTNLAPNGTATQSTLYPSRLNFEAANAIDQNTDGRSVGNSITHTRYNTNAWWELDLGANAEIEAIQLWNRTDCCAGRLHNFYVFVSEQPFTSTDFNQTLNQSGVTAIHYPGTVGQNDLIPVNDRGQYLRVQLAGSGYLTLAEVEVMGCFVAGSPPNTCSVSGNILMERWDNIGNSLEVSAVPINTTASSTSLLNLFEIPVNAAEYYGARVRGYICPPVSGDYSFWIASDDKGELWLSTDDNPVNAARIAYVPGWTSSRLWTKYPEQQSATYALNAGQRYYIEAIVKERAGGDNLAVGWTLPDGTLERPLPGTYLSPWEGGASARQAPISVAETYNINVYPNPADHRKGINLSIDLVQAETISLHLLTVDGRVIMEDHFELAAATNQKRLALKGLASGLYLLHIEGESWQHTERIMIK
ncbi:MAG: PQQ-dependent sugar dehydrogenase [Bacteroidota bacterium]